MSTFYYFQDITIYWLKISIFHCFSHNSLV